jgi:DNA-binding CsgD family transcriptional regulator
VAISSGWEAWIDIAGQSRHSGRPAQRLTDRISERRTLDRLIGAVRAGESRVLVLRGEPGIGKTALLDYASSRAANCRVRHMAGVQSEMELAFSGLHQLLAPMLDHLESLPGPQRDALRTTLGLSDEPAPNRLLVGLAVLGLLSDAAGERPLICLVDDVQWLDQASAQVLGFVARRLGAEPIGLVFAARVPGEELAGLPELVVDSLGEKDARTLLDSVLPGSLDARVRDQIVAETGGNPLALLELPRAFSPTELAGGFALPEAVPVTSRIEEGFERRLETLPAQTRLLLRLAAADPTGDSSLLWRAARRLGIPVHATVPAAEAGLVEFGVQVRFQHPLVRSAAYQSASARERREAHNALAEATNPAADPDRRAWHRAAAVTGPDEEVAAELERSADRARARGGLAAAAAFLKRAGTLTADPARRAGRMLAAAEASARAGAFAAALDLLAAAESGLLDELQSARLDLIRGQVAFTSGRGSDAAPLLLEAAKRLRPINLELAREVYLDAWSAANFAEHLAGAIGDLEEVSLAAQALSPPAHPARPADLLLDGLVLLITDGPAAAAPTLRQASSAFASADTPAEVALRWGWLATTANETLWDYDGWRVTARQAQLARDVGALEQLPFLLNVMSMNAVLSGDSATAAALIAEVDTVFEATGSPIPPYAAVMLASFQGREAEASRLIQSTIEETAAGQQGSGATWAYWSAAVLCNGLGRYEEALAAARQASEHGHVYVSVWVLPELIEAAVRTGNTHLAEEALDRLAEFTQAGGTDDGLGIEARSRALLSPAESAEAHYREAISRLTHARRRPELARAHLLFGEWLRRERRRGEAREQLRTACEMLDAMGMEAFAERARRELQAAGEIDARRPAARARGGPPGGWEMLTAQEAQAARLALAGLSNPEIGARLFISARTVQYHLSKVFTKLGISSRTELHRVLPGGQDFGATD